jgi:hypothetical protein
MIVRALTAQELSILNKELTLALIGARGKARKHIEKVLEVLNGKDNSKNTTGS